MQPVQLTVTSDFICPWCHIGNRKLAQAIARLPPAITIDVAWLPFELNPGLPAPGVTRRQYRTAKFGSWERAQALDRQVAEAGAAVGLVFAFDRIERTPSTMPAHRLMWAARQRGMDTRALADGLFRAYFEHGHDISDPAILRAVADAAGVPAAAAVLDGDDGATEVRALVDAAYRRGVDGVPCFEIGGSAVSGAQPAEQLEAFLRWGAAAAAA